MNRTKTACSERDAFDLLCANLREACAISDDLEAALRNLPVELIEVSVRQELESGSGIYLVVDGLLSQFVQLNSGKRQYTSLKVPGEIAGLEGLIAPANSGRFSAMSPQTVVLNLPDEALRNLVGQYPILMEAFWYSTARHSAIGDHWLAIATRLSGLERTAHFICELAWRYYGTQPPNAFSIEFPFTQLVLGEILGVTSVHVNRMMRSLAVVGNVTILKHVAHVEDLRSLSSLAQFRPGYLMLSPSP